MNRRGFIRSLIGGVLAAGVAPNILAGAGRKWVKAKSGLYIINPDWVNAPFELTLVFHKGYDGFLDKFDPAFKAGDTFVKIQTDLGKWEEFQTEPNPYPRRFLDAKMEREVPPFKYA